MRRLLGPGGGAVWSDRAGGRSIDRIAVAAVARRISLHVVRVEWRHDARWPAVPQRHDGMAVVITRRVAAATNTC